MQILLLPLALFAADAATAERVFGDWAVACDNTLRCEAVSLLPDDADWEAAGRAVIAREAGPAGRLSIEFDGPDIDVGTMTIEIDGNRVAAGRAGGEGLTVEGVPAEKTVRAMANGKALVVGAGKGKPGTVSLKGSSAALRYIDAVQKRAGTVTALVAMGGQPVASVPPAPPMPQVPAFHPRGGGAPPIDSALFAALARQAECDEPDADSPLKPSTYRLDPHHVLALVPCGSGAYNYVSAVFVLADGKPAPARFLGGAPEESTRQLVNAGWDATTGVLSSFDKARGLADCGSSERFVWDGTGFRLIEATRLDACRGASHWITVFRARPAYR